MIQTGINTCWQIKTKDKIVFLEDINEPGYKIDRILHHFSTINLFQNCKMIVFGNFNKSDDNIGFVLDDFSKKNSHIPIVKSNQIGHSFVNKPIILQ